MRQAQAVPTGSSVGTRPLFDYLGDLLTAANIRGSGRGAFDLGISSSSLKCQVQKIHKNHLDLWPEETLRNTMPTCPRHHGITAMSLSVTCHILTSLTRIIISDDIAKGAPWHNASNILCVHVLIILLSGSPNPIKAHSLHNETVRCSSLLSSN